MESSDSTQVGLDRGAKSKGNEVKLTLCRIDSPRHGREKIAQVRRRGDECFQAEILPCTRTSQCRPGSKTDETVYILLQIQDLFRELRKLMLFSSILSRALQMPIAKLRQLTVASRGADQLAAFVTEVPSCWVHRIIQASFQF